jgi:hypothetical protein
MNLAMYDVSNEEELRVDTILNHKKKPLKKI